jgi:hypothetical protein
MKQESAKERKKNKHNIINAIVSRMMEGRVARMRIISKSIQFLVKNLKGVTSWEIKRYLSENSRWILLNGY